jgi:hypothetical protein
MFVFAIIPTFPSVTEIPLPCSHPTPILPSQSPLFSLRPHLFITSFHHIRSSSTTTSLLAWYHLAHAALLTHNLFLPGIPYSLVFHTLCFSLEHYHLHQQRTLSSFLSRHSVSSPYFPYLLYLTTKLFYLNNTVNHSTLPLNSSISDHLTSLAASTFNLPPSLFAPHGTPFNTPSFIRILYTLLLKTSPLPLPLATSSVTWCRETRTLASQSFPPPPALFFSHGDYSFPQQYSFTSLYLSPTFWTPDHLFPRRPYSHLTRHLLTMVHLWSIMKEMSQTPRQQLQAGSLPRALPSMISYTRLHNGHLSRPLFGSCTTHLSFPFPCPGFIALLIIPLSGRYRPPTIPLPGHYCPFFLSLLLYPGNIVLHLYSLTGHYCLSLSLIWAFCPLLLSLSALLSFPRARLLPYLGIVIPIIWLAYLTSEWYTYLCASV